MGCPALRQNRFGGGWDNFVIQNNLSPNQELLFVYMGNYIFQVVILG